MKTIFKNQLVCLAAIVFQVAGFSFATDAQCTNYVITVSSGTFPSEVSWTLTQGATTYAAGGAPASVTVCLNNGTYSFNMYDSFGDGWNGSNWTITCPNGTYIASGTLAGGFAGSQGVTLNGTACAPITCSPGYTLYDFNVTAGAWPSEVSWNITLGGSIVLAGGAPYTGTLCMTTGCYVLNLIDSWGDGWNGSTYTLSLSGATVYTGTLTTGFSSIATMSINGGDCSAYQPVTASECIQAVNVCDNLSFTIDPNGYGAIWEIPVLGSLGNPYLWYGDGVFSAWGSDNFGCLMNEELNSTWMVVNIWGGGSLEFVFGGLGTQSGYYDWIMYDYSGTTTCQDIYYNIQAPVRCNWNGVSWGGTGCVAALPAGGDWSNYEPPLIVNAGDQYVICFSNWSSVTNVVPLEFGGTAIVSCQTVMLPVELTSFTAEQFEQSTLLQWTTASEHNNDFFSIEHSTDGNQWLEIGQMQGAGESLQVQHYSHTDKNPNPGWNYYRLKQFDTNGYFRLSQTIDFLFEPEVNYVFPNPNGGRFYCNAGFFGETFVINNVFGESVPFRINATQLNSNLSEIELAAPVSGIYIVSVGGRGSQKLLVKTEK